MIVVADASAVGTFLLPDESGAFADFARQICITQDIHVPPHWPVEVANILWKAQRRKRIEADDVVRIGKVAASLAATVVVDPGPSIERLSALAAEVGLTAYDAAYLWQARSLSAQLLTTDGALRRVAIEQGLRVLAP